MTRYVWPKPFTTTVSTNWHGPSLDNIRCIWLFLPNDWIKYFTLLLRYNMPQFMIVSDDKLDNYKEFFKTWKTEITGQKNPLWIKCPAVYKPHQS